MTSGRFHSCSVRNVMDVAPCCLQSESKVVTTSCGKDARRGLCNRDTADPGSQSDACVVQACELMDALKKNLRQEHVLIHEFLSTFYTQVATCTPGCYLHAQCLFYIMLPSCASASPLSQKMHACLHVLMCIKIPQFVDSHHVLWILTTAGSLELRLQC